MMGIQTCILNHVEDGAGIDTWVGASDANSDGIFRWTGEYQYDMMCTETELLALGTR